MSTKVFISWSGPLSQELGEALKNWLPSALQFVKPYFSPDDIEKGVKWNSEISRELESSNIGIICLTKDNLGKPWILFEAGALSKSIEKSKVCPLLFDIDPTDVSGPLASFQGTKFFKEDFKRLFITINAVAGDSQLQQSVLYSVFEMWWPKLKDSVDTILKSSVNHTKKERRTERDILEELLELARINAARSPRLKISGGVLFELVGALEELQFIFRHGNEEIALRVLQRLDRPLRDICYESGVPEAYRLFRERFMERRPIEVMARERLSEMTMFERISAERSAQLNQSKLKNQKNTS